MADYLLYPSFQGAFAGELVYGAVDCKIPISARAFVDSVGVEYRQTSMLKMSGFESVKHTIDATAGTAVIANVDISFTGDIPTWLIHQLRALAAAINGGGLDLVFCDNWSNNYIYTGKWTNAGDFVESAEGYYGANIQLQAYYVGAA